MVPDRKCHIKDGTLVWRFTKGGSVHRLHEAKLVKQVHEWGGAAFEQGALSVLLWLSNSKYPVAYLPGHMGFMLKSLHLPSASQWSLGELIT